MTEGEIERLAVERWGGALQPAEPDPLRARHLSPEAVRFLDQVGLPSAVATGPGAPLRFRRALTLGRTLERPERPPSGLEARLWERPRHGVLEYFDIGDEYGGEVGLVEGSGEVWSVAYDGSATFVAGSLPRLLAVLGLLTGELATAEGIAGGRAVAARVRAEVERLDPHDLDDPASWWGQTLTDLERGLIGPGRPQPTPTDELGALLAARWGAALRPMPPEALADLPLPPEAARFLAEVGLPLVPGPAVLVRFRRRPLLLEPSVRPPAIEHSPPPVGVIGRLKQQLGLGRAAAPPPRPPTPPPLVVVGDGYDGRPIGVVPEGYLPAADAAEAGPGQVWSVDSDGTPYLVNSSLEHLLATLGFERAESARVKEWTEARLETATRRLRRELARLDPPALTGEVSWWGTVLATYGLL